MLNTISRKLMCAILLALFALNAAAMELEEAVQAALNSDQRLAASQSMVESRKAAIDEARSAYLPTVTLDAAFRRQDEPYTFIQPAIAIPTPLGLLGVPESELALIGRDTTVGNLSINQVLYAGGRRSAGMTQARSGAALAQAAQADTLRTVRSEVESLYIQRWHAEQIALEGSRTSICAR